MVEEYRSGQTILAIKVTGKMIKPMEKESLFMLTAISMMEIGWRIKHTGMVYIHIKMGLSTKVTGSMISSMEKVLNFNICNLMIRCLNMA